MLFQMPVTDCVITGRFNDYRDYSKIAPNRKQLHEGIDFAPSPDREVQVQAAQSGVVHFKGYDPRGYGNFVVIQHTTSLFTLYAHLQVITITEAQPIEIGACIGLMGATGNATGKHLHFNIQDLIHGLDGYVYPKVVDPLPLLVNKIDSLRVDNSCYDIINTITNSKG